VRRGECLSFGSLKTEEKTKRQCGQRGGDPLRVDRDVVCQFSGRLPNRSQHNRAGSHRLTQESETERFSIGFRISS
jgi:hypothetical protein